MLLPSGNHEPNLVVAHSICENCCLDTGKTQYSKCFTCGHHCNVCSQWNNKTNQFEKEPCEKCGQREMIFRGKNMVKDFCQWLFSSQYKNIIAIAHNARSYNAYFLYKYIINQSMIPNIIFQGSKIMYCHVGMELNIKLLDSLNFLNMPLSKLPKSFGLKEMSKGYFPHLYNTQEINGDESMKCLPHLPDIKDYDADNMSMEKHEEFLEWHQENQHYPFILECELLT